MRSLIYFRRFFRDGRITLIPGGFDVRFEDTIKEWEKLCRFIARMQEEGVISHKEPETVFVEVDQEIVLELRKLRNGMFKARIVMPY